MDPAPTVTVNVPQLNAFVMLEQQAKCAADVLNNNLGTDAVKAAASAVLLAFLTAKP